jgi:CRISPR-associated endonuclease/helicase Cas3
MTAFAHTSPDKKCEPPEGWQPLAEHARAVANLANKLARAAFPEDSDFAASVRAAGLLHDLGKYRREFQEMLWGRHPRNEATRHKQAGAAHAAIQKRADLAFVIVGHHGGIPDLADLKEHIDGPNGKPLLPRIWEVATADCPELATPLPASSVGVDRLLFDWQVRLLFSCLVDADWQDTGNHEARVLGWPLDGKPPDLQAEAWRARVLGYIGARAASCQDPKVAELRREVLDACLKAADLVPGMFTMTVPTGGGKTLSGLAFALAHAERHGLRRVIYVAPYLTILDQNAREIRRALQAEPDSPDADIVFEHHSLAEPGGAAPDDDSTDRDTRRAENWDAPVVVTTNVQFFESLFANRPGACRKLHNICRSVVILDECQTLPTGLVQPTCQMLRHLVDWGGCSVVLCTATQPAWNRSDFLACGFDNVREIVPRELNLFERLRRVKVAWPKLPDERWEWDRVAEAMRDERAALCIVNTRRAARELFHKLREAGSTGLFHLSTTMCPAHRLAVLDEVRRRLAVGKTCHLVSTQLIEAGCDVDFPLVLRELAPLEAVIQSAGRCNREGLLNPPDGTPGGKVIVFRSPKGTLPPDQWYKLGVAKLEQDFLSLGREPDIGRTQDILDYFQRLYRSGDLDREGIEQDRLERRFATAASKYRLIDDTTPVVVKTWEPFAAEVQRLLVAVRHHPTKANFRRLAPYQINLRHYELLAAGGSVQLDPSGVRVWLGGYDPALGLSPDNSEAILIV